MGAGDFLQPLVPRSIRGRRGTGGVGFTAQRHGGHHAADLRGVLLLISGRDAGRWHRGSDLPSGAARQDRGVRPSPVAHPAKRRGAFPDLVRPGARRVESDGPEPARTCRADHGPGASTPGPGGAHSTGRPCRRVLHSIHLGQHGPPEGCRIDARERAGERARHRLGGRGPPG